MVLDFKTIGKLEHLSKIADFIEQATQKFGLNENQRFDIHTAVDEACENIITHAYSEGKEGTIEIRCELKGDSFVVSLRDYGRAFDPNSVPMPDLKASLEERKPGGLGVYFMKSLMDEVNYNSENGNELIMKKYIKELGVRN